MNYDQKKATIENVTRELNNTQWFNGCGFEGDRLIIAFNFYPALDLMTVGEVTRKYGVEFELRDIQHIKPKN